MPASEDAKAASGACVVLVSGKLQPGHLQTFITNFRPLAAHVAKHEEGCLAFKLSVAVDDPDSVIIYERYTSKAYLENFWQSEPFKAFQAATKQAGIEWVEGTRRARRYIEQDFLFAGQESPFPGRAFGENKAVKGAYLAVATPTVGQGQLHGVIIPLMKPLAPFFEHEENLLAYKLSVSEDEPEHFLVYQRYKSAADFAAHFASEAAREFRAALQSVPVIWDNGAPGPVITGYIEQDLGF